MHTLNFEECCMYTHLPAVTSFTHVIHSPPPPSLSLSYSTRQWPGPRSGWWCVGSQSLSVPWAPTDCVGWSSSRNASEISTVSSTQMQLGLRLYCRPSCSPGIYFLLVHTPACPYVFVVEKVCFISQVPRWNILPYKKHCVRMWV